MNFLPKDYRSFNNQVDDETKADVEKRKGIAYDFGKQKWRVRKYIENEEHHIGYYVYAWQAMDAFDLYNPETQGKFVKARWSKEETSTQETLI